ncbi:unnamed protein product [Prunus armeniaca]|uniref:Uncharacterized protein n=1 Tax=Prunus armeniaca TaxID=36596 RepID=A0A6J5U834_PRUAR|nr:unnamed protein product [Prunus armeniaca]
MARFHGLRKETFHYDESQLLCYGNKSTRGGRRNRSGHAHPNGGERPFIRTKVNPCALAIKAQEAAVATEEAKLTPAPKYRGTTTVVSSFGRI